MTTHLWPPLSAIRSAFETGPGAASAFAPETPGLATVAMPGARGEAPGAPEAAAAPPPVDLLLPLAELARRREAVAQRSFGARWAPGRLVSVVHEGRLLGVLLDRCIHGELWQGWMAAGEADWASAFDVLLEPDDEPFEPAFGLIQAWNVFDARAEPATGGARARRGLGHAARRDPRGARRVGRAGRARHRARARPHRAAHRGRRVRRCCRARRWARAIRASNTSRCTATRRRSSARPGCRPRATHPARPPRRARGPSPGPRAAGGGSVRRWLGADGWMRPAFAVLALCVVVQNAGLFGGHDAQDDVRFRAVPTAPAAAGADLTVRWKDGVRVDEADRLLQAISADVVGGPGSNGVWRLRVPDVEKSLQVLAASPLVEAAGRASERP